MSIGIPRVSERPIILFVCHADLEFLPGLRGLDDALHQGLSNLVLHWALIASIGYTG